MEQATVLCSEQIERMVNAYTDSLLRLAMHYTKNRFDAEDMVQTAFLQLVRTRPRLLSRAHERAWLIRTTVNIAKNYVNSAYKKTTAALPEELPGLDNRPTEPSAVLEAVRSLPEKYRAVIFLYYYEGFTSAEIASILKEPEGTVTSRLHRARKRLHPLLKGEFDG